MTLCHWVYAENFIEALLDKGHEVTAITNYAFRGKSHQNYTEVLIQVQYNYTSMSKFRHVYYSTISNTLNSTYGLNIFISSECTEFFHTTIHKRNRDDFSFSNIHENVR